MENNIAIRVKNLTKVYQLEEDLNPFKESYHHDFYALNDENFESGIVKTVEWYLAKFTVSFYKKKNFNLFFKSVYCIRFSTFSNAIGIKL